MSDIIDAVLELAGDITFPTEDGFIDRKSVIDFLSGIENLDPKTKGSIVMYIESLPAVQPDHIADIGKKASISYDHEDNLISRQAAINVLHGYFDGMLETDTWSPCDIYGLIELLPSAQPDRAIIDDCLHHIYKNISVHTATGGVIAIRYYMEKLYEEIYGEDEKPWWMK